MDQQRLIGKLNQAISYFQNGKLLFAEQMIMEILRSQPKNFDAVHFLGVIKAGKGETTEAITLFKKAAKLSPNDTLANFNLAKALTESGNDHDAMHYHQKATRLDPSNAEAWLNYGRSLHNLKRNDEALAAFNKALGLNHDHVVAWVNRGVVLNSLKRFDEALASYDRALSISTNHPETWSNRGNTLRDLKRYGEALDSYDKALKISSNHAVAWSNRGGVLYDLKRYDEALNSCDTALSINPERAEAWHNRGNALRDLKRYSEALSSYDMALRINHNFAETWANRGNTLRDLKQYGEALISYDRALKISPNYAIALAACGNTLNDLRRYDEAQLRLEKAIAINPELPYVLGAWLDCKMNTCDWKDFDEVCAKVTHSNGLGEKASTPFSFLAISTTPAQQQRCAQTCAKDKYPASLTPIYQGEPYNHERIRVGYFSTDFRDHPVAHLITHLIECHDRAKFEIIGFSLGPPTNDSWRKRLESAFDRFLEVSGQTDREIATLARELEIDIAIDLNGHTQFSRMGIFAFHPAPLQANYLGYPGTVGADYFEYLIADKTLTPYEDQVNYDEKIVYLPHTYQVNDSTKAVSTRSFTRMELGLPDDAFVFCCFNNTYKITPDVFAIWMRLLKSVDKSVLWLPEGNASAKKNLCNEAKKRGLSSDRLVFAPRMESLADHLARYSYADLFLDTFYYNAHTTASDALWAGLPVLTCMGDTFAGRVATSLLTAVGLPELITHSHAEYESLGLKLAAHPEQLAAIRQKLAVNITTQPLFDTERFARHLEEAYLKMHERYQAGLPPDHIVV